MNPDTKKNEKLLSEASECADRGFDSWTPDSYISIVVHADAADDLIDLGYWFKIL